MCTMFSLLQRRETGTYSPARFFDAAGVRKNFVQRLKLDRKLEVHRGCVNTICWNESGSSILSGSDDQNLVISDPYTGKIHATITSGHRSNIFSARFLPNCQDKEIVSCSGSGSIYYTQVDREDLYGKCLFDCHVGTTYEIVTVPNEPRTFLSCGEDGTVRWFDLRIKTSCNQERCKDDVLINCRSAVTSIAVDPILPYQLAAACGDGSVRIYDRRMLATRLSGAYSSRAVAGLICRFVAPLEHKTYRITSLNYSPCSHDILASYSAENVYLFNTQIEEGKVLSKSGGEAEAKDVNGAQPSGASGADPASQPPTKRLRLRGDWSDTGPNARPERERVEEGGQPQVNLMQRMSDMLTRWLDGSLRRREDGQQEGAAAPGGEGEGEGDGSQEGTDNPDQRGELSEEVGESGAGNSAQGDGRAEARSDSEPGPEMGARPDCHEDVRGAEEPADERGMLEEVVEDKELESERNGHDCHCPQDCELDSESRDKDAAVSKDSAGGLNTVGNQDDSQNVPSVSGVGEAVSTDSSDRDSADKCNNTALVSDVSKEPAPSETDQSLTATSLPGDSDSKPTDLQAPVTPSGGTDTVPTAAASQNTDDDSSYPGEQCVCARHSGEEISAGVSQEMDKHAQLHPVDSSAVEKSVSPSTADPRDGDETFTQSDNEQRDGGGSGVAGSSGTTPPAGNPIDTQTQNTSAPASSLEPSTHNQSTTAPISRLEPVISLHYSEQGTTASTIRVGYARFDVLDSPNNGHVPPRPAPPQPHSGCDETPTSSAGRGETGQPPSPSDPSLPGEGTPQSDSTSQESGICNEQQSVQGATMPASQNESENVAHHEENDEAGATADAEKNKDRERETTQGEDSLSDQAQANTEANLTADTLPLLDQQDPQPSTSGRNQGEAIPDSGELSSGSGSRHRRMGHSGPPTGDFQLVLDADDDNDSDNEGEGPSAGSRGGVSGERHYAATCMQNMYRKRMEEREQREMAAVYHPLAQHMYTGHRNSRTMIKEANFWGESVVMSGSDCGRIFLWDRETTQLMMLLEADRHVVNCLQPHPFDPILASSGIDYDVKIWAPLEAEPSFDNELAEEVMRRNQIMLEETRDTITVPAAFMLRVLASLNQIRAGRAGAGRQQESPGDSD